MTLTLPRAQSVRKPAIRALGIQLAALVLTLLTPLAVASAEGQDDPDLEQRLDPELALVHGEELLQTGHVDLGPKYADGQWTFLIHDDAARADAAATSVWRYPAETVLRVLDQAQLTVPDDPNYAFIGADPGQPVWVVPQTQNPDALWLGWNTQDPEVMRTIDRGITLSLTGVQGPGIMTSYLQSGSFGEPQLLWDSRVPDAQPIWVDVNTHTHANWVFTAPGVYLVQLEAAADLIDGTRVSDSQVFRFAVGTATDPAQALTARWDAGAADAADPANAGTSAVDPNAVDPNAATDVAPEGADSWLVPVLIGAIVLVAAGLLAGAVVVIARGNSAKRRALAARSDSSSASSPSTAPASTHSADSPASTRSDASSAAEHNRTDDEAQ
jgi:surface-anchored protein